MDRQHDHAKLMPGLLGAPRTDVAVEASLIRPEGWQRVDLAALAQGDSASRPRSIVRLGGAAPDSAGTPFVEPVSPPRTASTSPVDPPLASDDSSFVGQTGPRRLARVVRRAPPAGEPELLPPGRLIGEKRPGDIFRARPVAMPVRPLAAPRGVVWQAAPGLTASALTADRGNARSLIVLMIALWLAVLAFGIHKATTPQSGLKIKWDDR